MKCPAIAGLNSQGGVEVPTGGMHVPCEPASARTATRPRGQQIRCEAEADGQSPDERGGGSRHVMCIAASLPYSLIFGGVTTTRREL
jgi:hypothetical protein